MKSISCLKEPVHRPLQRLKNTVWTLAFRAFPSDIRETILVSGSPRSGTTWLAELLLTLPNFSRLLDEPLHLASERVRKVGVEEWRTYVAPTDDRPELESYLWRALHGQVPGRYILRPEQSRGQRLRARLLGKPLVVKFVRASRMLHWMHRRFPVRAFILILRHPCAVVASQLTYETSEWRNTSPPDPDALQSGFGGWIPDDLFEQFESVLVRIRTTAGHLAAMWCLDTYISLCYETGFSPGFLTAYERLVAFKHDELRRLFRFLGEAPPVHALEATRHPSRSAADDLAAQDAERQLSKWQRKLSTDQVDEILGIVEDFGLDFYTDDLHPDSDRLMQFQCGKGQARDR